MKPLYGSFDYLVRGECLQVGEIIDPETFCYFVDNSSFPGERTIQLNSAAEVFGSELLYDTISKDSIYSPWKYRGQCKRQSIENKNPALMNIVYVCSRYRGKTKEEVKFNIEIAKYACLQVINMGAIPIAPHLYFTRFLDDDNEQERAFGMGAGKKLMQYCNSFHVLTIDNEISEGMEEEIKHMTEVLCLQGSHANYTKEKAEEIISRIKR